MDQFNLADYATPITDFLEGNDVDLLTDAAKKLTEGDLVALAWRNQTKRTEKLGVRDLVSIEQAFSKPKALLRRAGKRSVEELWAFLGESLDAFAPPECRNYIRHCGYHATPTSKPMALRSMPAASASAVAKTP